MGAAVQVGATSRPVHIPSINVFQCVPSQTCESLEEIYLSFNDPEAIAVAVLNGLGIILTFVVGFVYIFYRKTPVIRASGRELSILILIGLCLSFAFTFLFCVKPTALICGLR